MDPEGNGSYDIPAPTEPMEATCAFLVAIMPDGKAVAWSDINTPVTPQRVATLDDMYGSCAQVMRDVQNLQLAPLAAQMVINGQMQIAQQVQDAKFATKLAQKGMRMPGGH